MDFITGLPLSSDLSAIMVVIDRLTKYAHFLPLKADYSSKSVADTFMNHIVKLQWIPKLIVSDKDKIFTSSFWQHMFKLQGTMLAMSSAYHPQSEEKSKILNKCLETYLWCLTYGNPKGWVKELPLVESWYNSAYHISMDMTPFKVLYGREPLTWAKPVYLIADPPEVIEKLNNREKLLATLKANLLRAQQVMKSNAEKKRT